MVDSSVNDAGKKYQKFLQFDVATDDSDHYYVNKNNHRGDCFTNASSKVYKRIMKERLILQKKLPKNITVRFYEKRIDLFRAVIVGAAGTASHDGLFVFDFVFTSYYPLRSPKFCFRWSSFALGINVKALSLPKSLWGSKNWNPSNSTVLQVLVHIQNILPNWVLTAQSSILNENKVLVLKKSCVENNDDLFVASCQRMLVLVQNPPKNFEAFVAQHFRKRGNMILKACKAYKNGDVRIGSYREDKEYYDGSVIKVSDAFKASIETLYPQLFTAFMELGASSVSNFVKQIDQLDTKTVSSADKVTPKVKHGISNKIVGTMMKILGFNAKA